MGQKVKVLVAKLEDLNSWDPIVEGENQVPQAVLSPPHLPTHTHTHTAI